MTLPDIQKTEPEIKRYINQVGVENIELPFILQLKSGGYTDVLASVSLKTNLKEDIKGISMSRLLLTLKPFLGKPLKHFLILEILKDIAKNLETKNSMLTFKFKLPIIKKSPISNNEFPLYYKSMFEGHLLDDKFSFYQGVTVQYSSYCPCSAELCKDLKNNGLEGFPHAQRSFSSIIAKIKENNYIWLEDLIFTVENSIRTQPYPIIKRIDEQEIARIAAENPIFVEDAIRVISQKIDSIDGIEDWIIKCSHEESIHTSEAVASSWKGIQGGFDEKYFLQV